jgi:hypothetical protein
MAVQVALLRRRRFADRALARERSDEPGLIAEAPVTIG